MRNRLLLALLVLAILGQVATAAFTRMPQDGRSFIVASWGQSWVEDAGDGRPDWILHLDEATPYLNGYAHGVMLAPEVAQGTRAYLSWAARQGTSKEAALAIWRKQLSFVSARFQEELRGLADGAGVPLEDLQAVHALPQIFHCCGFAAKGRATVDGRVYQGRSLDYATDIMDPVTGTLIQEIGIVYLNHGEGTAHVVWAGFIGSVGGTRVGAVTIGQQSSRCYDETAGGDPMIFQIREAVCKADAVAAAQWLCTNRTAGYNFEVSDARGGIRVVETTASAYHIGDENDQESSKSYYWYIPDTPPQPDVVRRTNHFLSEECGRFQAPLESSEGHLYVLSGWRIEQRWGRIDLERTSEILARTYKDWPVSRFKVPTEHQWAICTNTGEMLLRRAGRDRSAYDEPAYYYDLARELAERLPGHHLRIRILPTVAPFRDLDGRGGPVQCRAGATCSQGHPITYRWTCRDGWFDDAARAEPVWHAPRNRRLFLNRPHILSCEIACECGMRFTGSATVRVGGRVRSASTNRL